MGNKQESTPQIILLTGRRYDAGVHAKDVDGHEPTYEWALLEESTATSIGRDPERVPHRIPVLVKGQGGPGIRLFVTVRDRRGKAAYANVRLREAATTDTP